jgi:hypothetical protein
VDYLGWVISFAISIPLACYGIRLMLRAKKNNPESAKKIGKELIIGIIGGSVVALAVFAGEEPPILIPLVLGFDILLMGFAFAVAVE